MTATDTNKTEMICSCGEQHKGHICFLYTMGMLLEAQHLSDHPTVACIKCGAKANLPHNLCFPATDNETSPA